MRKWTIGGLIVYLYRDCEHQDFCFLIHMEMDYFVSGLSILCLRKDYFEICYRIIPLWIYSFRA